MSRKIIFVVAMSLVALLGAWVQAQTVVFENLTDWQSIKNASIDVG